MITGGEVLAFLGGVLAAVAGVLLSYDEWLKAAVVLLLALCCNVSAASGAERCRAVDGDTIACGEERVRLEGVDAPELGTEQGVHAQEVLADLLAHSEGPLTCEGLSRDRWGRLVARCTVGGEDLGVMLIEAGVARRCAVFDPAGRYADLEDERHALLPQAPYCRPKQPVRSKR